MKVPSIKLSLFICIAIILLQGGQLFASDTETEEIALPLLIQIALDRNPKLKAAYHSWKSEEQRYYTEKALNDPVFSYTYPIDAIETRLGPQDQVFKITQKLPFPGKLSLKGKIAKKEALIAKSKYELLQKEITADIKRSYYELCYITKAIEIAGENKKILAYFKDISKKNYGLDLAKLDEVVRAQNQYAGAVLELIKLNDTRTHIISRIGALTNTDPASLKLKTEKLERVELIFSLNDLTEFAKANHDGVRASKLEIEKNELKKKLARLRYLPDFSIGVNHTSIGEPDYSVIGGGRDATAVMFSINIPLWFRKNSKEVKASTMKIDAARSTKISTINEVSDNVTRLFSMYTNTTEIIKLYGTSLVPEAKSSAGLAKARYSSGEEKLARLLETQSMWLRFRLVYERALTDHMISIAELEKLTGVKLNIKEAI